MSHSGIMGRKKNDVETITLRPFSILYNHFTTITLRPFSTIFLTPTSASFLAPCPLLLTPPSFSPCQLWRIVGNRLIKKKTEAMRKLHTHTHTLSLSLSLSLSLPLYLSISLSPIATILNLIKLLSVTKSTGTLKSVAQTNNCNLLSFFCLDVALGCMNEAPNDNRTHSWRFASLTC